jgi:hypothetical protein
MSVQVKARSAYELWATSPAHPSLRFKKTHPTLPVYSVRIDIDWRAVGIVDHDNIDWFWIGSHVDYEKLLARL